MHTIPPRLFVLVLAVAVTGCATPYQSKGFGGGFSETQINARTFIVSFRGNGFTSREQVEEMALLRAAELTLQKGFRAFTLNDRRSTVATRRLSLPQETVTTGQVFVDPYAPGIATFRQTSTSTGGGSVRVHKPREQMTVVMLSEAEARQEATGPTIYDAQLLANQLRPKYARVP